MPEDVKPDEQPLKRFHVSQTRGPLGGYVFEAPGQLEAAAMFRDRFHTVPGIKTCDLTVCLVPNHQQ